MTSAKTPTLHLPLIQASWVLLGHLPVLLAWLLVAAPLEGVPLFACASAQTVATIVAGFCFTMMGFIVASLSILTLFAESEAVKQYRHSKYVCTLVVHVGITLFELGAVFLWALASVVRSPSSREIAWMVLAAAGCLGMTLFCCLPLLLLQLRAARAAR